MIELLINPKIKETFIIPDFSTRDEALTMFKTIQEFSYSKNHYTFGIYKNERLIGFINDMDMQRKFLPQSFRICFKWDLMK